MWKSEDLINSNSNSDLDFREYVKIIDVIKDNLQKNPDITIESCKTLLEGISKKILLFLDKSQSNKPLEKSELTFLVRKTLEKISEFNNDVEVDLINRLCAATQRLAEIRNERGDISHGKNYPKEHQSTPFLSEFVADITDASVFYILRCFYKIDLSVYIPEKYEDNPEFNSLLDEQHSELDIQYSQALYDQDYERYFQLLLEYRDSENQI